MDRLVWANALEKIQPYVFRIRTPTGTGTGFQLSYSSQTDLCSIATALHVVSHAKEWDDSVKLHHYSSGKTTLLRPNDRTIDSLAALDLAFIVFRAKELPLQPGTLDLIAENRRLREGVQIGWCGFPAIAPNNLCFFTGCISSYIEDQTSYLIDGVSINGISGGPSFYLEKSNQIIICGIVSAYIPNRATGEALPGVCVVRNITPYHGRLKLLKSLEEAESLKTLEAPQPAKTKKTDPKKQKRKRG